MVNSILKIIYETPIELSNCVLYLEVSFKVKQGSNTCPYSRAETHSSLAVVTPATEMRLQPTRTSTGHCGPLRTRDDVRGGSPRVSLSATIVRPRQSVG